MNVSVIGLGKLGLPIACALAARGVPVVGLDRKEQLLADLRRPTFFCVEPGVDFAAVSKIGQLTSEYRVAIGNSDLSLVIVPTPSKPNDQFDNEFVLSACAAIGKELFDKPTPHTVVIVSTVMPGSIDAEIRAELEQHSGKAAGKGFHLLYNPQFVALGTVIEDFTTPDVILIGRCNQSAMIDLLEVYDKVMHTLPRIAVTTAINAEIAKLGLNCAVSAKINFANHLARIAERIPGTDIDAITEVIGCDRRIGPGYLRAAVNYGGPCFPRDVRALATLDGSSYFDYIARANDESIERFIYGVSRILKDGTLGILGVPYKLESPVTDEALGWKLWCTLREKHRGCNDMFDRPETVIALSDVVVVCLPDPRYRDIPVATWMRQEKPRVVIDVWRELRFLDGIPGIDYIAVGVGPK